MRRLSDLEAAYLAGCWDCDGHIGVTRRTDSRNQRDYYRPIAQIGQVKPAVSQWVADVTGSKVYVTSRSYYSVRINFRDTRSFLEQILPYLVLKRRQAELVIEMCTGMTWNGKRMPLEVVARREAIHAELRCLNGPAPQKQEKLQLLQEAV